MTIRQRKEIVFLGALASAAWAAVASASAQTPASLSLELYPGLAVTGSVGAVYEIACVTDLAQTENPAAWRGLEFLQLPASPYLWIDKSAPAQAKRFYQAALFEAPTNLVFIPPGTFRMGSPTNEVDRSEKEGPQMDVTISQGFWMGKYLVTQGEYQNLTGTTPSYFNAAAGFGSDLTRPVDSVSWLDATAYCARLTEQERAAGRIPTNGVYRLPTEAEWEYACRAWTSTRFGYGDDPGYTNLASYAWFYSDSKEMTHPVGQKQPNAWGLYDMHGNLEQWCQDWFGPYPGGKQIDPQGPVAGSLRVIRGGYWEDTGRYLRSASRNEHEPDARHFHLGFRVVLTLSQP